MPSTSSSTTTLTSTKPYDRPNAKSKGKAKSTMVPTSTSGTSIGAPAQLTQSSRKGKKAWRKHIDVTNEEEAMEQAREEERVTGGKIADKKNSDLFVIDTVGDVEVAQKLRRAPKPLRSLAILSERSAVPSLTARQTASSSSRKAQRLSNTEKSRLRRIARRETIAEDGTGAGSADIRKATAVAHDPWSNQAHGLGPAQPSAKGGFGEERIVTKVPQAPKTLQRRREVYFGQVEGGRGVDMPNGGVSYNPSAESHQALIDRAVEEEMEILKNEAQVDDKTKLFSGVVTARRGVVDSEDLVDGMVVGAGDEAASEPESESELDPTTAHETITRKQPRRKTQADRNRAIRARDTARLLAIEQTQKRLLKSIAAAPSLLADAQTRDRAMKDAEKIAKLAKRERERLGLEGGEKIGKWRLPKGKVDVQLGEDLAESLRQVKPEGNLFKDRFLALQKKALVEPRVPQLNRTKEYEKHAYKRFQ